MVSPKGVSGTDTIIEKVGTGGLIAESHPATEQLQATTAYRYTGVNPDNYVLFNYELWRIIGVFDVDDGTGKLEKRIKIIGGSIGNIELDSLENDWSKASWMTLLNSGNYWNRAGSYASNGLTGEAKIMIDDAKWYLGGTQNYDSTSDGLASHWYSYERGTTVYSGRPTSWVGKVALMYPSDYGYATSGGTTTNRDDCLVKEMYSWDDSLFSDCKDNDWLYDSSNTQWTLTPYSGDSEGSFFVGDAGYVDYNGPISTITLRPSIYLSSDILISGGTGTQSDPYTLSI